MDRLTGLQPLAHNLFRMIFGFAFFTHGAGKLFGWFGGNQVESLMSEFGAAGIIEFAAGLLIMIGFQTNWAAFIAAGEMAVAYFWKHSAGGDGFHVFHWQNRGELAMLLCFAFLLLATIGGGSYSVDALLARKKPTS